MSDIIEFDDYIVTLSECDNAIYLNITNNKTFGEYEGKVTLQKDLRSIGDKISLNMAMQMIKKSFLKEDGHKVIVKILEEHINLHFYINIMYILFEFDFVLRKKEVSCENEGLNPMISYLKNKIEDLENENKELKTIIKNNCIDDRICFAMCLDNSRQYYLNNCLNSNIYSNSLKEYGYPTPHTFYDKFTNFSHYLMKLTYDGISNNKSGSFVFFINNFLLFLKKNNNIVFILNSIKDINYYVDEKRLGPFFFQFDEDKLYPIVSKKCISSDQASQEKIEKNRIKMLDEIIIKLKNLFDKNSIQYIE